MLTVLSFTLGSHQPQRFRFALDGQHCNLFKMAALCTGLKYISEHSTRDVCYTRCQLFLNRCTCHLLDGFARFCEARNLDSDEF